MQDLISRFILQKLLQGILHQTLRQHLRRIVRSGLLTLTTGQAIDEGTFFIHAQLILFLPRFITHALFFLV